jgi:amidase
VEPDTHDGWDHSDRGFAVAIGYEAWQSDGDLMVIPGGVHDYVGKRIANCAAITEEQYSEANAELRLWRDEVLALLDRVAVLALPTLVGPPPGLDAAFLDNSLTCPFNAAGTPAISIPMGSGPGESIQLVAAPGGEELLLATAAVIEAALA